MLAGWFLPPALGFGMVPPGFFSILQSLSTSSFVMMIMTVGSTLVVDDPFLTNALVWLVGVDVLLLNNFISEHIHGVTGESVLESLG